MATGTLFDLHDNPLLNNCTIDQAVEWLRNFEYGGWHDAHTIWVPDHNCVVIYDANSNFEHLPRHHATLPTAPDHSHHFPE